MKLVAISQRVDYYQERNEVRDALDQRLANFVNICGYLPIPVPNSLGENIENWLDGTHPSGIIISGGNNIGENAERDKTELSVINYAAESGMPLWGICRGMQMMAHWSGVGLHPVMGHVGFKHAITGKITDMVNSYHSFSLSECPNSFEVIARSADNEIEAIRHLSLPWEGWMWHPEREANFNESDIQRLRNLFQ